VGGEAQGAAAWVGLELDKSWVLFDRADPIAIDFSGNGALEEGNGDDNAPFVFFLFDDDAFESDEWALFDTDTLALGEVGPRLGIELRLQDGFDGGDFIVWDG